MKVTPFLVAGLITCGGLMFFSQTALSASLYIDPATSVLNRGDSITMSVRLDTDEAMGECINAVDAVIAYSDNIEPTDVSIGDSIFPIWVEQPVIDKDNRTITFAGGIPNGYCGRVQGDPRLTNTLAKLIFRSPGFSIGGGNQDLTVATVSFLNESAAYLNDGRGTKASLTTYGAQIELSKRPGDVMQNSWRDEVAADTIKPEEFSISLHKDDRAFSQQYYIVFNTMDKQTGIDRYEVMEEPLTQFGSFQWGSADAPWVVARSPYVVGDQTLNSIIRVKAVDKAGNEYIAHYIPDESLRTISYSQVITYSVVFGIVLLVIVLIVAGVWYQRRKRFVATEYREASDQDSGNNNHE